jgi:glutamate 5-kinase
MEAGRKALAKARRIIIKIGSNAIADHPELIPSIADEVADLVQRGSSFVIVSSGAIALGWKRLGYRKRPREVSKQQAAAATGQSVLMNHYAEAFGRHGLSVAQVLLTHSDLSKRNSLNNARAAFAALLEAGAVPIVNENDTVSTEEIRFGDNDQLAATVCSTSRASGSRSSAPTTAYSNTAWQRAPRARAASAARWKQRARHAGRGRSP